MTPHKLFRVAQSVNSTPVFVRRSPLDIAISFGACSVGTRKCQLEMEAGSIRDHNRDFIDAMKQITSEVVRTHSIQIASASYQSVMSKLRDAGLSAYVSLGDQVVQYLHEYQARCPTEELEITVRTESHPLLWEFLYDGSPTEPVDPRLFWGYHHCIARFLIGAEFLPTELDPHGSFLFCRNHKLGHWQDEMESLRALMPTCDFVFLDDCLDELDLEHRQLVQYDQALWVCTSGSHSFVHMASHLFPDPRPDSSLGAFLEISYRDSEIQIPLRRLNALRGAWHFHGYPLIFLNACKTMTNPEQLGQGENFPRSFLKLGAGAVIATACDVPDLFAVAFARKFYEIFLDHSQRQSPTASEALCQARRYFVDTYNNPLGLAYGLYAYNDLTIYWEG